MSLGRVNSTKIWRASEVTPIHTPEVCPKAIPSRDREGAVSSWVTNNLQLTPDNLQTEVLDATENRLLLLCTRQWGKSTIAAAKALHHALTTAKALILVASASKRQSAELVRKFKEFAETIGLKTKRDGEGLTLPNCARIIPVPQSPAKVRCYSAPTLIIIDEAAFVEVVVNALCPADHLTPDGVTAGLAAAIDAQLSDESAALVQGQRALHHLARVNAGLHQRS